MAKTKTPQQDAGWGLIFRLNDLWRQVEQYAPKGEYDEWNFKLDRIWVNLLYRNDLEIKRDKDGNIVTIKLDEEDIAEKEFLDKNIFSAKAKMKKHKPKAEEPQSVDFLKSKREYYNSLMLKDIWLRKFMNSLGLYLKEVEYDPSKAIYGG